MVDKRSALLVSVAPIAFASRPQIGTAPSGAPLYAVTPANAQGPVIGQLYALPAGNEAINDDAMMKRSPDSAAMLDYWNLTDTLIDGTDAVRAMGETYLPRFTEEETTDYQMRLKLTKFTNVYRDIIEGLAAKPFEEEIKVLGEDNKDAPPAILDFAENVDGNGANLTMFASETFFNGINSAIDWIWIDYPPLDPNVRSMADAKASNRRPFWSHILGRNVLWPVVQVVNGLETLTYLKIYEPGNGTPDHVREFIRDPNGNVTWRLFEKLPTKAPDGKPQWAEVGNGIVTIGIIPVVPFFTGRRDGRSFKFFPAMRDAADLQIELYQQESGLKFLKTLGAYSMLAGQGVKPQMEADQKSPKKIRTGPMRVLYAPPTGEGRAVGKWEFIQPDPAVMTFLAADVKTTIDNLRELGRQPLTAQSGNLTVITTAVAAGKSRSAVSAWALMLKNALENALVITCKWLDIPSDTYDPQVDVFAEFDDFADDTEPATLTAMRTNGDLSQETLWEEMKRRGILSAEFDADNERERLMDEIPSDTGTDTGGGLDPTPPLPQPTNAPPEA